MMIGMLGVHGGDEQPVGLEPDNGESEGHG